ncbi:MAG: VCBS repeat-containing protein [Bryobacteraceae bacterium]|nr:VCBS repeat-containing protein [Bryobacteraceae bacterium]
MASVPKLSVLAAAALAALSPACGPSGVRFEHIVIDADGPVDTWLKTAGDLNGDGRIDLVAGGVTKGGLVWYENPSWRKHVISPEPGFSTDGEVADIDKDGDNDLGALTKTAILWLENPSWKVHHIDEVTLHDVEVADLDGDGDLDLVARNQGAFGTTGNVLYLYRQDAPDKWTKRTIDIPNGEGLHLADIDGDGDMDVVVERAWFENPGRILDAEWTRHEYGPDWAHPHAFIASGDINGDGRLDIVASPSELAGQRYRISWFEAPADPKSRWMERVVQDDVEAVHHFIGVADFDGDGSADIATAEMHQGEDPDEVRIYFNRGKGARWSPLVLATTGSHSMRIVDVDGDGDKDLFGANHRGNVIELWKRKR